MGPFVFQGALTSAGWRKTMGPLKIGLVLRLADYNSDSCIFKYFSYNTQSIRRPGLDPGSRNITSGS